MNNPYIYQRPLPGQAGFSNRTSEITRITSRIAADRPQSVSIVGGPRTGKTSMLNFLCDPEIRTQYLDDSERYIFLLLNLEQMQPETPEAFFAGMAAAVRQAADLEMEGSFNGFSDLIKRLMQQERKLVLFLDDFGWVTNHSGFALEFFSFMRSVANSNDVAYVTTSPQQLQKLCHTQDIEESPFFNIFTTVTLEPFKAEAARALVEEQAAQVGLSLGARTDWILKLGGRSPYLLQLTAHLAYEQRDNDGLSCETLADQTGKEARAYLDELWGGSHSTEPEREVMRAVCKGEEIERRLEYAAESLERRGELERNGNGYQVTSDLVKHYIEHGAGKSIWKRLFG